MAAGHPKLKTDPGVELFLSRFADGEWHGVVRPWLERGRNRLERALLVAPTRGQTQALKQRCVAESVALLGVEFLTPGLARKKREVGAPPGRSLELLLLRSRIEDRVAPLAPDDPARLLWKSLASDLEAALDDFEDLIRAGFRAADFPRPELRELFGEMESWLYGHGYALAPLEDEAAGVAAPPPGLPPIADRLLILAGGPEGWGDFFGLAALARRCPRVCVVVAEPEFKGAAASGESWVEVWQALLGVEAAVIDAPDPDGSCADVAAPWNGADAGAGLARVIVARSMTQEMERVASALERLLERGADNIAVVFPRADAAHERLARLLGDRSVPFADMIGAGGAPPLDTLIQRAMVDFYERGCRLEELLALWPLLRSLNLTSLSPGAARAAGEKLFEQVQSHGIEPHLALLDESRNDGARELGRVAKLLLPSWPARLTLAEALDRFESARDRLMLGEPPGWPFLREFARRSGEGLPAAAALDALRAFLPEKGPAAALPGRRGFAHVTLTTVRRAAGVAWSHVILVEANAGIWPERREPSCWLGDDERLALNRTGRFSLGLPTGDERAALERRLYSNLLRDTLRGVIFSASVFDGEDPEVALEPNAWLERVIWRRGFVAGEPGAEAFGRLAGPAPARQPAAEDADAELGRWGEVWNRRRDPGAPFDEFFFSDPGGRRRPSQLSASLIQKGIEDPVRLWFDAVLRVARVEWRPFGRARRKSLGDAVHRVLAAALHGPPHEGNFFHLPSRAESALRLEAELAALRARWPANLYWDSFHLDVGAAARDLLEGVFDLPGAPYAAVEIALPEGTTIPVGGGERVAVRGRMDFALFDRPGWDGAHVEIADFKTGGDARLSARTMASRGASLQLGVYLEAARSLGATGSVWMLKPGKPPSRIAMGELEEAVVKLEVLGLHLARGIYGALTPDRDEYTAIFEWPLACAPIAAVVLHRKFAETFGPKAEAESEGGSDE
jgi:hypothetical protein